MKIGVIITIKCSFQGFIDKEETPHTYNVQNHILKHHIRLLVHSHIQV